MIRAKPRIHDKLLLIVVENELPDNHTALWLRLQSDLEFIAKQRKARPPN